MIPFDIKKWKAGWKPVTRDGRKLDNLQWFAREQQFMGSFEYSGHMQTWYESGRHMRLYESDIDLFLLPPDEDAVVTIVPNYGNGNAIRWDSDGVDKLEPGRYKLVKID